MKLSQKYFQIQNSQINSQSDQKKRLSNISYNSLSKMQDKEDGSTKNNIGFYNNHLKGKQNNRNATQTHYYQNRPSLTRNYDTPINSVQKSKTPKRYAYIQTKKTRQNQCNNLDFSQNSKNPLSQLNDYKNSLVEDSKIMYNFDQDIEIKHLRSQLYQQRRKYAQFQMVTVQNQMKILGTINDLQLKLKELKDENVELKEFKNRYFILLDQIKQAKTSESHSLDALFDKKLTSNSFIPIYKNAYLEVISDLQSCVNNQNNHRIANFNLKTNMNLENARLRQSQFNIQQKTLFYKQQLQKKQNQLEKLTRQHKKIKAISTNLVDMMKKVDGIRCPQNQDEVKYAWKWVKKIVWEYEGIRKKANQWKKAYDQLYRDVSSDEQSDSNQLK